MTNTSDRELREIYETLVQSHSDSPFMPVSARKEQLYRLQQALKDNEERIYRAIFLDMGRPRFETYVADIAFVVNEINLALRSLPKWVKPRAVKTPLIFQPGASLVMPQAKGVVLIMAPWNYPFQLSLVPLVSAIAAGNSALIKPSEIAYESSLVIADIINNYLDKKRYRAVLGEVSLAKAVLDLPFDHIFFTGSTSVGREVLRKAAANITPTTLELGGKCPSIVDKSANLNLAVKRIVWAKCLNAGQTCIAPDYVLLDKDYMAEFLTLAKKHIQTMFGQDIKTSDSFGRIINHHHFDRLASYLKQGSIAVGGNTDRAAKFIEPTILTDVAPHEPLMQEEIFGPILPLLPIDSVKAAIDFIRNRPHPLALYIFSNNKKEVKKIVDETQSGGVAINDCLSQVAIKDLPFGGINDSGMGRYHGIFGFETFSHIKAIYKRANLLDNPVRYPPYSNTKLKLAKSLL